MTILIIIKWFLIVFGILSFLPFLGAQFIMLIKPKSKIEKDLIIGKGKEWRDKSHYKTALAFAWGDWLIIVPIYIISNIGIILNQSWGNILWIALGLLSIYFSIVYFIMDKENTYPSCGPVAYYTYFWGFPLYWGIIAVIYSIIKIL